MNVVGIIIAYGCITPTIHAQCQTLITAGAPKKALEMLSFLNRKKKSIICCWELSTFEQSSNNDRNIIPTDCSEGFGMYIDWWLNLNAVTYWAASSRKRVYFIPLWHAIVRKYPPSLRQKRKNARYLKENTLQIRRRLAVKTKTWHRSCIIATCRLIFPLRRLSGQWLSSFSLCFVIMVSLCDRRTASATAKGQKVLLCLDIGWENCGLSFSLSIYLSSLHPSLYFLF